MPAVESSAIAAIDHDPATGRLTVRFVSGDRYVYSGVPAEVYEAFLTAPSKGRFFAASIRDRYRFARDRGGA